MSKARRPRSRDGPARSALLRFGHSGPILAVAGGSGLAPILQSAIAQGMRQPIRVYFGGRDEYDLYGLERLTKLAEQHGDMTVTPVLSSPSASTTRRVGIVHAATVQTDLDNLDGWKCYIAGPPAMIDTLTEVFLALSLQRGDLHADVFFTPETTTETVEIAAAG